MKQKIYQIDAFTSQLYGGNPAAVCILEDWLPKSTMQNIAMENNLAETAFVIKGTSNYEIRWFTPETEVDLCGHATLAAAYVLYNYYDITTQKLTFSTLNSGLLYTTRQNNGAISLDFPVDELVPYKADKAITDALGMNPKLVFKGKTDILLIFSSEEEIVTMCPDFFKLNQVEARGIIVSAPGENVDFVSRFFAPRCGINEDPVTGSAHTSLTPYWAKKFNKKILKAKQLSKRGGEIECELQGNRVILTGKAVLYLEGYISI